MLFVVPSEPLVWQVAAFFSQLLRDEGDVTTKVALVTDQMTFNPLKKFDIMPQIVVGTPMALESSLTKVNISTANKNDNNIDNSDIFSPSISIPLYILICMRK